MISFIQQFMFQANVFQQLLICIGLTSSWPITLKTFIRAKSLILTMITVSQNMKHYVKVNTLKWLLIKLSGVLPWKNADGEI